MAAPSYGGRWLYRTYEQISAHIDSDRKFLTEVTPIRTSEFVTKPQMV